MFIYAKSDGPDAESKGSRSYEIGCKVTSTACLCALLVVLSLILLFVSGCIDPTAARGYSARLSNASQEHPKILANSVAETTTVITIKKCDDGWTEFNNYCFKHFNTPKEWMFIPEIKENCAKYGAVIASGATKGEREFMEKMNRPSFNDRYYQHGPYGQQMIIGISQGSPNEFISMNPNETIELPLPWCAEEPNQLWGNEHCIIHHTFANQEFCYHDVDCRGFDWPKGFQRHMCKKPMN